MIAALLNGNCQKEALSFYESIDVEERNPIIYTLAISACASEKDLPKGARGFLFIPSVVWQCAFCVPCSYPIRDPA